MNQNQYTTGNFQSPYGQTETYPNQEGNCGQMRFAPVEFDEAAHEVKKLRQKMKKVRHETEEMRCEMEILHQGQEEIVRYLKHLLMRLSASGAGAFGSELIAMQLELPSSGHRKKNRSFLDRI